MNDAKQQVVDRLKQANNILVTVRRDPSVDLLSACIGLSLALDKMEKHAAAVFSGQVPSTIEFLKPQQTIESTPNSLRDFIIALDKSKADKLRYKVEDKVVRIFITPYKTSITQDDLEFSQGDFNVDAIVALGAHEQEELDDAVTAHGRILHDATVISINNTPNGNLGAINWQEIGASSISEMTAGLIKSMNKETLDEQISTALLTGIVAETNRFSNEKTTPTTMSIAGDLMAAGANQQLVATQLQGDDHLPLNRAEASAPMISDSSEVSGTSRPGDGTLEIKHEAPQEPMFPEPQRNQAVTPQVIPRHNMLPPAEPRITDVHGVANAAVPFTAESYDDMNDTLPQQGRSYLIDEPTLPANTPKGPASVAEPSRVNPFDVLPVEPPAPLLDRDNAPSSNPPASSLFNWGKKSSSASASMTPPQPQAGPAAAESSESSGSSDDRQTLQQIEESVRSPHLTQLHPNVDVARNQVLEALQQGSQPFAPLAALNANPLGDPLHPTIPTVPPAEAPAPPNIMVDEEGNMRQVEQSAAAPTVNQSASQSADAPATPPLDMPLPSVSPAFSMPPTPTASPVSPPPPVPPPLPPNFMNPRQ